MALKPHRPLPSFLVTTKRNAKGQVVAEQAYRLYVEGSAEFYEVPKGSGNWIFYNEQPIPASKREQLVNLFPIVETPKTLQQVIEAQKQELAKVEAELAAKKKLLAGEPVVAASVVPAAAVPAAKPAEPAVKSDVQAAKAALQAKTAGSGFASQMKDKQVSR